MDNCPSCAVPVTPFAPYCGACFAPLDEPAVSAPVAATVPSPEPQHVPAYAGAPAPTWEPAATPTWAPAATATWGPAASPTWAPPTATPTWGPPGGWPAAAPTSAPAPSAANARKVWATTGVAIGLGALLQLGFYLYGRDGTVAPDRIITYSLLSTAVLYLVVLVAVLFRAWSMEHVLTPQWTVGSRLGSAALGTSVGVILAGILLLIMKAATGEPVTDAGVSLLVGERDPARTLLAVLVVVVGAPVVEELLFRGLLAEGLRDRGTKVAVWASAAAFSAWHLQPAQFRYYAVMGALLGLLYVKRGLICSMSAHAAFNGLLVVVAIAVAAGPARLVEANGVSISAPAQWKISTADLPNIDLALDGPSGAGLVVHHEDLPPELALTAEDLLAQFNSAGQFLPGLTIQPASARIEELPQGRAVRLDVTADGQGGQLIVVPIGRRVWSIVLIDSGSDRAKVDFAAMLPSLRLP